MLRICLLCLGLLGLYGCSSMGMSTLPYEALSKKYTNETSHYLDVNGLTIHYQVEGEGPPLVLLHGVGSSLHSWDSWVKALKTQYRIYRLDLPGFGLTGDDVGADSTSAEYMVNMLDGFVTKIGLQRFFLVGSSLGGYYAWNYAEAHPEKLYKMVLISAAGYPQEMPFWIGLASFPGVHWITPYMMPKFVVNKTAQSAYFDEQNLTDEVKARYFDLSQRRGNRASYVAHFRQLRKIADDASYSDKVKDVLVPTLLMWGEKDEWIPLDVMTNFHRDLAYSEYIIYEGVGHLPMEEVPVQSARDADHFFMSELQQVMSHPQESQIKFYDGPQGKSLIGQSEELGPR